MLVTADEVGRSLRGTVDLLNQRAEGLRAFDFDARGFRRSFTAIGLTLPAYVVALSLEQRRISAAGIDPWSDPFLLVVVGLAHVAAFLSLPLAVLFAARGLGVEARTTPFVIVTNWIGVVGVTVLSGPTILLLLGWATPGLAALFTVAGAVILLRMQYFATRLTLGVSGRVALAVVALDLALDIAIHRIMMAAIG